MTKIVRILFRVNTIYVVNSYHIYLTSCQNNISFESLHIICNQITCRKTMLFERSKRSMDEMKIGSKFTTSIISKLASLAIRKKFGYDVKLNLNEVKATVVDGKTHVHLDIDADLEKDELTKILKSIGL